MIDQGVTAALAARDANRNGNDSHTSGTGAGRTERVARECTYQDFMKCQPLYFKGTEGVIKFSTYLRKKMTDKYSPRNEMKKLEAELWNFKVKGTDVTRYNQTFQETSTDSTLLLIGQASRTRGKLDKQPPSLQQHTPQEAECAPELRRWDGERKNMSIMELYVVQQVQGEMATSYIKVFALKRVVRFGKRGKLNLRDVGPFKALARVEALAYKLSCLKKIMDREVKRLKQSRFPIVKVRWNSRRGPEFIIGKRKGRIPEGDHMGSKDFCLKGYSKKMVDASLNEHQ
ncbi:hypothetical protein Tco_1353219 [Tanacetum coccineum]